MTQELSADEKAIVARIGIHDPEVAAEWRDTTAEEVTA